MCRRVCPAPLLTSPRGSFEAQLLLCKVGAVIAPWRRRCETLAQDRGQLASLPHPPHPRSELREPSGPLSLVVRSQPAPSLSPPLPGAPEPVFLSTQHSWPPCAPAGRPLPGLSLHTPAPPPPSTNFDPSTQPCLAFWALRPQAPPICSADPTTTPLPASRPPASAMAGVCTLPHLPP